MPQGHCLQSVQMLQTVRELMLPAAHARLVLLVNHIVSREPAALQRLASHAGRRLRVEWVGVPPWLPSLPPAQVLVTPAGMFELEGARTVFEPDLTLRIAMPGPKQVLAMVNGAFSPDVRIEGDAAVAADLHWLADNLRWDIEADLAQWLGPTPARLLMSFGRAVAQSLRRTFANATPAPAPDGTAR